MSPPATRGTVFVEDALVLAHDPHPGEQRVLRFRAPEIAARARPGSFVHIQCDATLPMRRPMSIMHADARAGTLDILYKVHGLGTRLLAAQASGRRVNLMGPIGVPFRLTGYRPRPLLIGGGVGIPPMVFLALHLRRTAKGASPLVLMGSEVPFPFRPRPSQILVPGVPAPVIAAMPLMEDHGIASRLASLRDFPGCFEGYVTDLARGWLDHQGLDHQGSAVRAEVEVFACGPTPMLKAVIALCREYRIPGQISVEEFMACALGGCAGCTVRVETDAGPAMKRVCVDGPVFDAERVGL
ncbi:MAG: dihydroorotate dehydrogenase electron transfer subunit [Gammaproteobacteria bacterium]